MNKKRIGIFIALVAVVCLGLNAQRATSLKINEVLVTNEQNYQDDYGLHNAWIEIFNTSFATVNIEGCYLTNDKDNPTKYPIPKGDVMPNRGTFHVNFTLDPNKENYIALYDSNGKTLIDEITIPAGMLADQSYARQEDGSANWVIKGGGEHSYVTPSTNNMTQDKNEKIENFKKHDEDGFGMAIIAMSVVFIGLILLYVSFKIVGNIAVKLGKKNAMKATGITDKAEAKEKNLGSHSGEEAAAIAMALHEFMNDAHDVEDMILTINKVKRTYSPWSSKIYTLRQTPKR